MIVLTLEMQRHAINTALAFSLSPMQQAHIAMSSVATGLYFPVLFLGWKALLRPISRKQLQLHRRLALTAYTFRTLGFLLMFALLGR